MAVLFKKLIKIAVVVILMIFSSIKIVLGAKGVVVYIKSGCDYFIVRTASGYALLEWYEGSIPRKGDIIVGDLESYGFKDIYNLTADSDLTVWVEDYWLTRDEAMEKYFEECY